MARVEKGSRFLTAANQNEANGPVVADTGPRTATLEELAKVFDPVVARRPVRELKVNKRNARTHSKRQVMQVAASIRKMGFLVPVVIDESGNILAGHCRVEAASQIGLAEIPTIRVEHLTPELKRTFALADNRLAELAGWDEDLLADELLDLSKLCIEFEFEVTGFDTCDLDRMTAPKSAAATKEEIVPDLDRERPPVSAPGDLWKMGDHLLYCGSALEDGSYQVLMGSDRAQMLFADPPYNVKIDGHVCGLGSVHHRPFQMASGEMDQGEFTLFLARFMRLAADFSTDGSIHYVCMDFRHMKEILAASEPIYAAFKNLCVWNKTNAGMGTFYRSKHELVFVFKVGTALRSTPRQERDSSSSLDE